jgi:hypothetical protein
VRKGNQLAIDGTNIQATYDSSGNRFSYVFAPPLVDGQGARGSTSATGELLVQADIELDADGDGFGDETQDQCPTQAATQGPCDTSAPTVTGLRVAGGRIAYTLSEAGSVELRVAKRGTGRRVRGRCVRRSRANRRRPRCTRFTAIGRAFAGPGNAGPNARRLPARLGGRRLGPGRYRLTLTVRDIAGNQSTATKSFSVKPKRRR